jgi:hypothetical protein
MVERLATVGLQYAVYFLEGGLFVYLLLRGHFRRLLGLSLYVVGLLAIDAAARPYILYRYGLRSPQYAYAYWLTDALLTLGAFALICALFRRACAGEEKLWHFVKVVLGFVFVLVLGITLFSLSRHYNELVTRFVVEFEQNLYFTCLVLNTLLYVLLQRMSSADEELGLLVCGLGVQFAGPAASYALVHLTPGHGYAISLNYFVQPLCTMGMLLTWLYAAARTPKPVAIGATEGHALSVAEAAAGSS